MTAALPTFIESRAIEDIDAMAGATAPCLKAEYVQLEAKRFTGRWTNVQLPQMVLQKGREDIAIVRRLRATPETWAFIVPLRVSDAARWDGRRVTADELIVCAPGGESYAFDPAGTEFAIVSVGGDHPVAAAASRLLEAGETSCAIRQRARDAESMRRTLISVLECDERADRTVHVFEQRVGAEKQIAVESRLAGSVRSRRIREAAGGRRQIVGRAEAFFRHHMGESVTISRLSAVVGVSERSLRNAFCDVYTTSPKKYLRLWQLHEVRRALRSASCGGQTVTDVATFHGFFELGRFAGEYKALFGEPPSQTLQRARLESATRPYA